MNAKFIVNDYALIWNLLFQASISEVMYKLKQKLWDNYKKEYDLTYKDKALIMADPKNFIPNNDTIYNILLANKEYEKIKKQTEKYRLEVMRLWDKNKKETTNLFKNIIRKDIPDYTIFVVAKNIDIIEHNAPTSLVIGKEFSKEESLKILLDINMEIIMNNTKKPTAEEEEFKMAILELAVLNEYATKISKKSCYLSGNTNLASLKRWLYPYWLMYLGIPKEKFKLYMMRDKIAFDANKYAYEKELKKMNIEEFISFCTRNQKYIIRETVEEVI